MRQYYHDYQQCFTAVSFDFRLDYSRQKTTFYSPLYRVLEFRGFFPTFHSVEFQLGFFFFFFFFFFISDTLYTYKFQTFKGEITYSRPLSYKIMKFQILMLLFCVKCPDFQTYLIRIWFGIPANFPVLFFGLFFLKPESLYLKQAWDLWKQLNTCNIKLSCTPVHYIVHLLTFSVYVVFAIRCKTICTSSNFKQTESSASRTEYDRRPTWPYHINSIAISGNQDFFPIVFHLGEF